MNFMGKSISMLLLCMGISAVAQTPEVASASTPSQCISQAEMAEIASHFTQFESLKNAEFCIDDSPTGRLLAGIMFMRKTVFAKEMPTSADELFSGRFATNWYQYFIGRIDNFEIQTSCPKGAIAFVYFFGTSMYVCPAALTPNFTSLDLASVFMHEARHIDGFPHMTCSHGPRQGLQGACDTHISAGGSYAVSVETYAQIAKYAPDLHPAMRAYSRSSAVIYADEAFEQPVNINRQAQFLVMTDSAEFYTVDTAGQLKRLGDSPALGKISLRSQLMVLYPDDKTLKAKYLFVNNEGELNQEAGDIAIEYNSQTEAQRAEWVGVHISGQWAAKVMKDRLQFSCDPRSEEKSELSTNGEVPANIIYPEGYSRAAPKASVVMESGRIYDFGCERKRPFLRTSTAVLDQPYKRIHKAGADLVGLGLDGKLYKIQGATSTPLSTALDGRVYDLVPYQTYGFFDL